MDERGVKYFEVVVRSGSIRRASDHLHIAASAISRQIRELENNLGVKLLDRLGRRGVTTTGAGALLLRYIRESQLREDNFLAEVSEFDKLRTGTLRIASGAGFARDLVTNVFQIFSARYPGIHFILSVCPGDEVLRQVRDGRADVGLLVSFPVAQSTARIPTIKTVLSDNFQPLSLVVNSKSHYANLDDLSFPELQSTRLALLNETFIVRHLIRTFEAHHCIRLTPILTCNSFESITAFLLGNLGASILPPYCVAGELVKGTLTSIALTDVPDNHLTIDLIVNKERAESKSVAVFCDCVTENMMAFNLAGKK